MKHIPFLSLALAAAVTFVACVNSSQTTVSEEDWIEQTLAKMSVEQKVKVIHAQSKFSSAGVPELGIPELWCTDGPHGIRPEVLWDEWVQAGWTSDSCVAFPALTCLAATWNREMSALYGKSIGEEARYREKDVLLGPGVNILRTPLGGRNFEYMGEDPYLAGEMAVPYIKGVQANGVATCVKHYCLNNEETHRHTVDIDLDDRALYEIFLPAFKKAVQEGGSWSIMSSYNLYRGQHVCHNKRLLVDILKGEWGFDGAVISDWGGVHDTDEAIRNGMDIEFGTWTDGLTMGKTNSYDSYYLADPYLEKIRSGEVGTEELDDKVRRVLRLIHRTAMNPAKPTGSMRSPEHYAAARKIGGEGIVLLKNEGNLLPVKPDVKKILVVGENAVKSMIVGGGSSSLKAQHEIYPLTGITERAEVAGATVKWVRGYVGSTENSYNGVKSGQDLSESRSTAELVAEAIEEAAKADLVLFVGGLNKSKNQDCEGKDREGLELPYGQDNLIEELLGANPNTAVILISGNPVAMPWIGDAPAVIEAWHGGSEAGHALADVLWGDVNPSGHLPFTWPATLADCPAHQDGMTFPNDGKTFYSEGILVGYRWFDTKGIAPLFPFGHGLSYTSFALGAARTSASALRKGGSLKVSVPVTNTGDRAGAEVIQLYISDDEASVLRPEKELKGFEKVCLQPGETRTVTFDVKEEDLQFFDADKHEWVAEPGTFTARIGTSAGAIATTASFNYSR